MDKLSYALGMSLGQSMIGSGVDRIVFDDLLDGIKTIYLNRNPKISAEEGNQILGEYFDRIKKEKEENDKKIRETNLKFAEEFLKENKEKKGVITTESGLQYKVIAGVTGKQPTSHSRVKCHYEGRFFDGKIFDSSFERGEPTIFSLEQVIPGWTEGLQLMSVGSKYEFFIPPQLGYGEVGVPGHIPGNSLLIFTVELLDIVE